MKRHLSIIMIALVVVMSLPVTPSYADNMQGVYGPLGAISGLGISIDDLTTLRPIMKDYYAFKGKKDGIKVAINDVRDANPELDNILTSNGITVDVTKDMIETVLNTIDPNDPGDMEELVGKLDGIKGQYQHLIDNLDPSFRSDIDFKSYEGSRFATYFYNFGKTIQNENIITFDNYQNQLYFSFAQNISNNSSVNVSIDGSSTRYGADEYLKLAISNTNGHSIDDLDAQLQNTLNDELQAYLNWSEAKYTAEDIKNALVNLDVVELIDTTPDPDDGDDDNDNTSGGGGGGFTPPAPEGAPRVNTDSFETSMNVAIDLSISSLTSNDENYDAFVSAQNPTNGSIDVSGDTITFTPDDDFSGRGLFYYTIENEEGDEDTGVVIIDVSDEVVIIEDDETPLSGGPNQLVIIDDEGRVPLATVDFTGAYIDGYPDGTFRPNEEISRAEMAAIFCRILDLETDQSFDHQSYVDVPDNRWFYSYVEAATEEGIFDGYSDNTFKPEQSITHAEMAAVFSKYWIHKKIMVSPLPSPYTDIEGHWASAHIDRFFNAGINVGYADGTFRPNISTTRAELVIMVNQLLNREPITVTQPTFKDVTTTTYANGYIEAAVQSKAKTID